MKNTSDIPTLRAFGNLKDGPVREFIKSALAEIDGSLRRATGDTFRTLQGQAQVLEEMAALVDDSDALIVKARAQAAPKSKLF